MYIFMKTVFLWYVIMVRSVVFDDSMTFMLCVGGWASCRLLH
jgi:hypothetical protein